MRLSSSAHSARFARQLFRKRKKKKEKVNFGTDKKNTVENLTQQTGGCSEEGHPICAAATKKSLFLFWQEEIEIERVREREARADDWERDEDK